MKAAARAAAMGASRGSASKAVAEAARAAAAKVRIAAAVALSQFCSNPENAADQQCVALEARRATSAAQQQKLMEYNAFCDANYWSFSCSAIWGWLALLVVIVLICCCCCDCHEDDRRNRNRPVAFINMRNERF